VRLALGIETSTRRGSVAAQTGAGRRAEELQAARAHASDLMPAIDRLARELGAGPGDLEAVLVGTGPGSYTGLRVGIATALALARATGAKACGVPSGEALAFGALDPGQEAVHLIDARAGGFYVSRYRRTEDEVEVLLAPRVVPKAEVAQHLGGGVPILTDAESLAAAGLDARTVERARLDVRPEARALLALGLARLERLGAEPLDSIRPLYLRAFGR
jgi:tRNA threonylcarbamoyladenosine biosynthesis protein TsaB